MKNFWPHRPDAKGFSIENLARTYREKISSASSEKNATELANYRNLNSAKDKSSNIVRGYQSDQRVHWANRDFSEYRDVA